MTSRRRARSRRTSENPERRCHPVVLNPVRGGAGEAAEGWAGRDPSNDLRGSCHQQAEIGAFYGRRRAERGQRAGEADVHDRQLTIAGIPADGGRPGAGTTESLRAGSRSRETRKDAASVARRRGKASDRPPAGRPSGPQNLSAREVYDLGIRTDLVTACRIALGVGSTTAYALAGRGELPFPVHRVGRQWVVPTAGLLAFLGLPPKEASEPVTPDRASGAQG